MEGIYLDPKSHQRHKEIAIGKVRDGLKKLKFILYEEGPKILRVK